MRDGKQVRSASVQLRTSIREIDCLRVNHQNLLSESRTEKVLGLPYNLSSETCQEDLWHTWTETY
uniref:Uncharacterized protein n=1 Tax=Picea glauca TaxID=3330 RepID=A0A101LUJ9_PICGL|nr:hypothetical protein ABT39_MTgene2470 [Picea glauca]QHR88546.1 hypothetical protein Q903MT_gene2560 [Picea sitchensis]